MSGLFRALGPNPARAGHIQHRGRSGRQRCWVVLQRASALGLPRQTQRRCCPQEHAWLQVTKSVLKDGQGRRSCRTEVGCRNVRTSLVFSGLQSY